MMFLAALIKTIVIFISYGYAALSDYIKREINPLVWIPPIALGVAINIILSRHISDLVPYYTNVINTHVVLSVIVALIIIVLTSVLSFILGLMGGADVLALAAFASLYPANMEMLYASISKGLFTNSRLFIVLLLPSVIIVLLLYLVILILLIAINILYNIVHMNRIRRIQAPLYKKVIYLMFGRVIRIKDFVSKRFYYPIYVPGVIERITFNIDEDYKLWIERLRSMDQETVIVATWGIPMVTFITAVVYVYTMCCIALMML